MHPVNTEHTFGPLTRAYLFTNERLDAILDNLDHEGKHVLAVTGAGDYGICASALGASVTSTDVTVYAAPFARLKLAALRALERNEFIEFYSVARTIIGAKSDKEFPPTNRRRSKHTAFSPKAYWRVRKELGRDDRAFFDSIIGKNHFADRIHNIPYALHFVHNRLPAERMSHLPYLASDEAYERMRCAQSPVFRTGDIVDAPGTYDIVYVSNVPHCLPEAQDGSFLKAVERKLAPRGVIAGFGMAPPQCVRTRAQVVESRQSDASTLGKAYLLGTHYT